MSRGHPLDCPGTSRRGAWGGLDRVRVGVGEEVAIAHLGEGVELARPLLALCQPGAHLGSSGGRPLTPGGALECLGDTLGRFFPRRFR